jgi:hypothetical protein
MNTQITLAEFEQIRRLMLGSLKEGQKLTLKIGSPEKATEGADKMRCSLCKKQLWDCRC